MRPVLLATLMTLGLCASHAGAQCASPYVTAYAPAPAATPVVYQTSTQYNGWYPGKLLGDFSRSLFGWPRTATTTYTAGYAPAYAAPTAYTSSYAPSYGSSPYSVGYAPTARYQTAYRPTYPVTYGPVTQAVSRPVVLSPVNVAPACSTGCDSCGGVAQSYYQSPASSGCSSCQSSATYLEPASGLSDYYPEPQPALGPNENPPGERSTLEKPALPDAFEDTFPDESTEASDAAASGDYWRAPPLFAPKNRVTQRTHPAPVHTAVYRQPVGATRTAFPERQASTAGKVHHVGSDGWSSAAR